MKTTTLLHSLSKLFYVQKTSSSVVRITLHSQREGWLLKNKKLCLWSKHFSTSVYKSNFKTSLYYNLYIHKKPWTAPLVLIYYVSKVTITNYNEKIKQLFSLLKFHNTWYTLSSIKIFLKSQLGMIFARCVDLVTTYKKS